MDIPADRNFCSRCRKAFTGKDEVCAECISELLENYDHLIGWKMALEIEREEAEGKDLSIEIQ
jgi:predicted amidophosphoribosyltransferase